MYLLLIHVSQCSSTFSKHCFVALWMGEKVSASLSELLLGSESEE